jgi:hypothetical protein
LRCKGSSLWRLGVVDDWVRVLGRVPGRSAESRRKPAVGSCGRRRFWQSRGQGFESPQLHRRGKRHNPCYRRGFSASGRRFSTDLAMRQVAFLAEVLHVARALGLAARERPQPLGSVTPVPEAGVSHVPRPSASGTRWMSFDRVPSHHGLYERRRVAHFGRAPESRRYSCGGSVTSSTIEVSISIGALASERESWASGGRRGNLPVGDGEINGPWWSPRSSPWR